MANEKKMTMGVIVGNRGFFPDHLAKSGREEILAVLAKYGINAIALGVIAMGVNQSQTPHGKVYITELNDSPASGVFAQVSDSTSHGKLAL